MSILKRSFLYLKVKRTRSISMLLILTIISIMLISGFSVKKTSTITQETLKSSFQSVLVTPKQNVLPEDSHGEGGLQKTEIEKLSKFEDVEGINASQIAVTIVDKLKTLQPTKKGFPMGYDSSEIPYLSILGNTNTKYDAKFISGMLKLVDGRHINKNDKNKVMIHKDYAKLNKLKIGDTIEFSKDPIHYKGRDFTKVKGKIIGVFAGKTIGQATYPEEMIENTFLSDENLINQIYGYTNEEVKYFQTNFYLKPKANTKNFVDKLKNSKINWSYFDIAKRDPSLDTYNRSLEILKNTSGLLYFGVLIVSVIILILVLIFWVHGKQKETGILLAIGKSKTNIILGYIIEISIISLLAILISFAVAEDIGSKMSDSLIDKASTEAREEVTKELKGYQLGADSFTDMILQTVKHVDVEITKEEYVKFYLVIFSLIITSTSLATLNIVRLKPRQILTKLS